VGPCLFTDHLLEHDQMTFEWLMAGRRIAKRLTAVDKPALNHTARRLPTRSAASHHHLPRHTPSDTVVSSSVLPRRLKLEAQRVGVCNVSWSLPPREIAHFDEIAFSCCLQSCWVNAVGRSQCSDFLETVLQESAGARHLDAQTKQLLAQSRTVQQAHGAGSP
jgi:hypothetical protein